jgi:hypothetical protein
MTSLALIRLSSYGWAKLHSQAAQALTWINATFLRRVMTAAAEGLRLARGLHDAGVDPFALLGA